MKIKTDFNVLLLGAAKYVIIIYTYLGTGVDRATVNHNYYNIRDNFIAGYIFYTYFMPRSGIILNVLMMQSYIVIPICFVCKQ